MKQIVNVKLWRGCTDIYDSIADILKAIDAVSGIESLATKVIRLDMDMLLGGYAERWHMEP